MTKNTIQEEAAEQDEAMADGLDIAFRTDKNKLPFHPDKGRTDERTDTYFFFLYTYFIH